MQWMLQNLRSLFVRVLTPIFFLVYVAFRKKLPVTWGNRKWFEFLKLLGPGRKIKKSDKRWLDYSTLPNGETANLLKSTHPDSEYRTNLNAQIINYYLKPMLADPPSTSPICIITSGGTASGKTSAVDFTVTEVFEPEGLNFLRIDYDAIKRTLPEYLPMLELKIREAAKYVQAESIKIGGKLFKKAYKSKINIIYEKTLDDSKRALEDIREMKKKNYDILIVGTHLCENVGQARAVKRFEKVGRHIPPEIITKIYSGVPKTLFEIRHRVDGILLFDNNGTSLRLMFYKDETGPQVTNRGLYDEYLRIVGNQYDLCT